MSVRVQAGNTRNNLNGGGGRSLVKGLFAIVWAGFLDPARLVKLPRLAKVKLLLVALANGRIWNIGGCLGDSVIYQKNIREWDME